MADIPAQAPKGQSIGRMLSNHSYQLFTIVVRHPDSRLDSDNQIDAPPWITPALLTVSLVVAQAAPTVGLWSLLVLFLAGPIRMLVSRRRPATTTT